MNPPGRRRSSAPVLSLFALIFLFFTPHVLAQSAVLGIDLGTEYIKAVLVKPGIPLEIVLTKDSRRKETSAIAFKASGPINLTANEYPERLYGADALALSSRFPSDVYPNLKHLLAGVETPFGNAAAEAYRKRYPALGLTASGAEGPLGFRSKVLGSESALFSVEELLAMELKSIRQNAQAMAGKGSTVRDAVITVPTFYTAEERRAVESAAGFAGIRILGLVSDGVAVGINYAVSRTFADPDKDGKAEHHLVYDMGAGATTATVLRFRAKTVKDVGRYNKTIQEVSVLGTGWDRTLGGDTLNDLIVNDMAEQFVESEEVKKAKLQVDSKMIKQHGRAMAKLTREAERVRQVLSANAETSAFFEGFYEDIDFRYMVSRSSFELMAASIIDKVGHPIKEALQKAGLSMEELDSVILHGGAIRTPFVQNSLENLVGDPAKLKSNVNADEAAVFGAAFKAAGLSPSFRVKEIKDRDSASYSATVHWVSNGKDRKQTIFQPTSVTGTVKEMPFKMLEDFEFSISQNIPGLTSDDTLSRPVVNVQVANLTATIQELVEKYACAKTNISTTISFHLDPMTALPAVIKGTASCESEVAEKTSGGGLFDDVKGMFGFGKKDQKPLTDEDDADEIEAVLLDVPESSSTSTTTTTSSATSSTSGGASKETKPAGPKFHSIALQLVSTPAGATRFDASAVTAIKSRLSAFDTSDRSRIKRSELFNTLESLTYRTRDLLTDTAFSAVSSKDQRSAIKTLLGTTSQWLSSSGADATYDAIKEKLSALQGLVDPIRSRVTEAASRPSSIQSLKEALNSTQSIMSLIRNQIDQAAADASKSAEEALSAATSSVEEVISSVTDNVDATSTSSASTGSVDDLDDLDSSFTSSSSSTASSSSSSKIPTPSIKPFSLSSFTEEDYTSLSTLYTSISTWLSDTTLAQEALAVYDDPTLTIADIERKAKQLGDATNEMLRKMMRRASATVASSSSSSKTKTSKTNKGPKSSTSSGPGQIRVPTPKVSIVTGSGAGPAGAGNEDFIDEPPIEDKILDNDANTEAAQPPQFTTDPEVTPEPAPGYEKADLPVGGNRDEL